MALHAAAGLASALSGAWKGAAEGKEKSRFGGEWRWCWLFLHQRCGHQRMTVRKGWKGLLARLSRALADGLSRSIRWLWGSSSAEAWLDTPESLDLWLLSLEVLGTSSALCLWPQRLRGGQSILDIAAAARAGSLCSSACSSPAAPWQSLGLTTTFGGFPFHLPEPGDHTTDSDSLLTFAALL